MDWPWRSLLNSELWPRWIAIRFRSSRGSLCIDVTTGSSYLKTPRHRRDEPSNTKDIQHQSSRSSTSSTCTCAYVSCDVLLPPRRRLTCKRRVVSKPNFGSQLWKRNGYICVYFYWPPGPNPVVTISTRVGPGSRLLATVSSADGPGSRLGETLSSQ